METVCLSSRFCDAALSLAHLAQLSYTNAEDAVRNELGMFADGWFVRPLHSSLGYVLANDEQVVLVFSGTKDIADWLYNLSGDQVRGYGGRVHCGFASLVEIVWEQLTRLVRELRDNDQKLFLTGHGRGGALASLAGRRFEEEGLRPELIVAFGAPRVGDTDYAANHRLNLYRIENAGDPIPRLPGGPYVSEGVRLYLASTGIRTLDGPDDEVANSLGTMAGLAARGAFRLAGRASWQETLMDELIGRAIAHHGMTSYLNRLQQLAHGNGLFGV